MRAFLSPLFPFSIFFNLLLNQVKALQFYCPPSPNPRHRPACIIVPPFTPSLSLDVTSSTMKAEPEPTLSAVTDLQTTPPDTDDSPTTTTFPASTPTPSPTEFPCIGLTEISTGDSYRLKLIEQSSYFILSYSDDDTQYPAANGVSYYIDPQTDRVFITLTPGLDGTKETYWLANQNPLSHTTGYLATWEIATTIETSSNLHYTTCKRVTGGFLTCTSEENSDDILFMHTGLDPYVYTTLRPGPGKATLVRLSLCG